MWRKDGEMATTMILGDNNRVVDCDTSLVVESEEVFRLREHQRNGNLVVDFDLRAPDGTRIAKIVKNYVVYAAPGYEFRNRSGRSEVVETETGKVIASVDEVDANTISVIGTFHARGYTVEATPEALILPGGNILTGNLVQGFKKAIELKTGGFGIGVSS